MISTLLAVLALAAWVSPRGEHPQIAPPTPGIDQPVIQMDGLPENARLGSF